MTDSDKIFLDGGFDPDWYESKISFRLPPKRNVVCPHHKKAVEGYTKWHAWAEVMNRRGIEQSQCQTCKHWFFPEEMGTPNAPKP